MTDGQLLFAVFAALYLIECLRWIPSHSWICVGRTGGRWAFRRPSKNFSARGTGGVLLAPLPPFRAHFVAMPWLFVPEDDHLCVRDDGQAMTRIAWENVKPRAEASFVMLSGMTVVRMPSESLAAEWSGRLREWAALSVVEKEQSFLDHAAKTLDADAVEKTAARLTGRTRALHVNASLILFWTFGVVSGVYGWWGETATLWIALLVLLGLQITQAILFWRATRDAEPDARVSYRFWKALSIALMPQHSVRAADHICRAGSRAPHPLAARLLLDPADFMTKARSFWRAARFQNGCQATNALPLEAVALERFFQANEIDISTLEEVPTRDHGSGSYCPRCLAQFQLASGECSDCGGVELRAFPPIHSAPID